VKRHEIEQRRNKKAKRTEKENFQRVGCVGQVFDPHARESKRDQQRRRNNEARCEKPHWVGTVALEILGEPWAGAVATAGEHDEDYAEHSRLAIHGVAKFEFHLNFWSLSYASRYAHADDC